MIATDTEHTTIKCETCEWFGRYMSLCRVPDFKHTGLLSTEFCRSNVGPCGPEGKLFRHTGGG